MQCIQKTLKDRGVGVILEHELPWGGKLYFDTSAKLKRDIESCAIEAFYANDYREIVTPSFSFLEHQGDMFNRELVRLNCDDNHQLGLRYDSTLDVMRITTELINRSNEHKKWFYIQPVFSYPAKEIHQIGAEHLGSDNLAPVISLALDIFKALNLAPMLQIANMQIPLLCAKELGIETSIFEAQDISTLLSQKPFIKDLLYIDNATQLESAIKSMPTFLHKELQKLLDSASAYQNCIISPLLYAPSGYYGDLFFRMFIGNATILQGGKYSAGERSSCGFAIYTDEVIECLLG